MNYPAFVFHELVFRLSEINPRIGSYDSCSVQDNTFLIRTSNGHMRVDADIISKQYTNPKLLSKPDLALLVSRFEQ